jgi:hypothetical protein
MSHMPIDIIALLRKPDLLDDLLKSIDLVARQENGFEYGLPLHDEPSKAVLRETVLRWAAEHDKAPAPDAQAASACHWTELEPVRLAARRQGRVYIAGPMTGLPDLNFPAFNVEAARLRAEGLTVINPAEHGIVEGADWGDYLRHDIAGLVTCERIHLLPGWAKSKGANLEVLSALVLGIEVTRHPWVEPVVGADVAAFIDRMLWERCSTLVVVDSASQPAPPQPAPTKCDGNHGGPRCGDPECWNDDATQATATASEPPLFAASVAARKWAELQEQGHRMTLLKFDGGKGGPGSIDPGGVVMWGAASEQGEPYTMIDMGFGKWEVGAGTNAGIPCIAFGVHGSGSVGELITIEPRQMSVEETHAVITFANYEGFAVLQEKMDEVRALHFSTAQPAPAARPMTDDQVWHNEALMSANGIVGFQMDALMRIVRAVEAHHRIDSQPTAPAVPAEHDPGHWCEYVAGVLWCWLQIQNKALTEADEDRYIKAITGVILRRLKWLKREPAPAAAVPAVPEGWRNARNDPPPEGMEVLVAAEFDGPGDWRIKVGGINPRERSGWWVFGASWVPQVWMPLDAHRALLASAPTSTTPAASEGAKP